MPTSPSPNNRVLNHQRIARMAILNGMPVPTFSASVLEAQGINVSDLEARIRQNMEFVR